MFKIKLLILLPISFIFINCSNTNYNQEPNVKYSIDYIKGGYDGLVLKKIMISYLRSFNMIDKYSKKLIKPIVSHSSDIYVTNIDNTSDRERITTTLEINIYSNELNCIIGKFKENTTQFYIYASNEKFLSNEKALETIKYNNTDELVKKFVNSLNNQRVECLE